MTRKNKIITWNFLFFIIISFYSMGAGFVESIVNYPLWHILGPSDVWIAYHEGLGQRIVPVLAVPALVLQFISNVLLFFFYPSLIPRWTIRATFLLLLVAIISSFVIQIPIQAALATGYSEELVDRLIKSDLIFRVAVAAIRNSVIIYMMYLLLRKPGSNGNHKKNSSKDFSPQSRVQEYAVENI